MKQFLGVQKCLKVFLSISFFLGIFHTASYAASVTLRWDANTEAYLAGYKIYYDTTSGAPYSGTIAGEGCSPIMVTLNELSDRSNPQFTLTGLNENQVYFFAVTAFAIEGLESDYSNEVFTDSGIEDSDGDEIADDEDAFPSDPSESLDTDDDGAGNNKDTDDDGDGMLDEWEISHGLNPLVNDASGDMDGDGISNIDEHDNGTDPTLAENFAPNKPTLFLPANESLAVSTTATLQTGAFFDQNSGDTHMKTQWQISIATDFSTDYLTFDQMLESCLTSMTIPEMILNQDTQYYWRARFFDNHNCSSQWSDTFRFRTVVAHSSDKNYNGVPDTQEVDDTVDLDLNGIADIEQDDILCVNTVAGGIKIGIKASTNVSFLDSMVSMDLVESLPDAEGKPDDMPFGYIEFKVGVNSPGDAATVVVYFSEAIPDGAAWYKYDSLSGWENYSAHAVISENRLSITLELKDGGFGDADGVENGVIVDPAGIGLISNMVTDATSNVLLDDESSGSSGCFIHTIANPFNATPYVFAFFILYLFYQLIINLRNPSKKICMNKNFIVKINNIVIVSKHKLFFIISKISFQIT